MADVARALRGPDPDPDPENDTDTDTDTDTTVRAFPPGCYTMLDDISWRSDHAS